MAARHGALWSLCLAALAALPQTAPAQFLATEGPAAPVQVILTPVNGAPAAIAADPSLPAIFPGQVQVNVGFEYLRPDFPGRSVTLTVPGGINGNVSALGGSGNVSYDFAFVPKFSAGYQFKDLGFGMTASGELASLSGHLNRTIDSAAGSANLTATSTVNFASANLVEGALRTPLGQFAAFEDSCVQDTVLLATFGARYSHLSQDYSASLTSGADGSTLTAHQDWDGFGVTTSLSFLHPLPCDFFLYGVSRGSYLVGTNNRNSTLSVVVSGNPAANTTTKLTENKTDFIPIGEFEVGVAWGKPLVAGPTDVLPVPPPGALLWIKAGLVADLWGSLGLLSAADNAQGFSDGHLFMWGFSVLAGVQF